MLSLFSCSETTHGVAEGALKPSIVTDHKLRFREAQSALNLRADGLSASHLVKALLVNQLRDQSVHPRKVPKPLGSEPSGDLEWALKWTFVLQILFSFRSSWPLP